MTPFIPNQNIKVLSSLGEYYLNNKTLCQNSKINTLKSHFIMELYLINQINE